MRPIDADSLLSKIENPYEYAAVARWVNAESTIELEQKRGEWIILDECANQGVYCSKCHKKVFKYDFSNTMKWKDFKCCPHCGSINERRRTGMMGTINR